MAEHEFENDSTQFTDEASEEEDESDEYDGIGEVITGNVNPTNATGAEQGKCTRITC
jgi:hypothetical protein